MASLTLIFTRSFNLEPTRPNGLVGCEVSTDLVKISVKEVTHMGIYYKLPWAPQIGCLSTFKCYVTALHWQGLAHQFWPIRAQEISKPGSAFDTETPLLIFSTRTQEKYNLDVQNNSKTSGKGATRKQLFWIQNPHFNLVNLHAMSVDCQNQYWHQPCQKRTHTRSYTNRYKARCSHHRSYWGL